MKKNHTDTAKSGSKPNHPKKQKKQRSAKEDSALILAILAVVFAVLSILSFLFLPTALQLGTLLLGILTVLCGFSSLLFGKSGTALSILSILVGFVCIIIYVIAARLAAG